MRAASLVVPAGMAVLLVLPTVWAAPPPAPVDDAVARGEYLLHLGGCSSCHTDTAKGGAFLAGGVTLKTPFGIFFTPNITPDAATGIGGWTTEDFARAMTSGVRPDGSHYFPAFPYTSYVRMSGADLADLKAYLDTVPAVSNRPPEHDLGFPFNERILMAGWKSLFFDRTPLRPDPARGAAWNRGAYIVLGPGHCVECHTARNLFGGLDRNRLLAGEPKGPESDEVPSIRADGKDGLGAWSDADILEALKSGMTPDGDFLGGSMGKVVANTTGRLTDADRAAILAFLRAPPAPGP